MSRRPEVCVGAVVIDDDRLLLIRRGHGPAAGNWSLPGGRVEFGETMAEALVREVQEETGLEVVAGDYIAHIEIFGDDWHYVVHDFHAIVFDPDVLAAGDDAAEAAWVNLHEVAELNLSPGLAEFLADNRIIDLLT
ncbi:MAG: 8-oxo-dGTP diphosphatase [Actinomycetota bacterium]|jgi:8-oxo-dGTP diphosphatase